MSRFFPTAAYAEDQPLARTILTTHVLHRGLQSGVTVGLIWEALRPLVRSTTTPRNFIRASGMGALWGTGSLAVMLPLYMWSQTDIQWKDRSWRLQVNKGQLEVDDWSVGGTVVGGLLAAVRGSAVAPGLSAGVRVLGGAGLGNMAGVLGYMVWRYGVNGGKFED